MLPELLAGRFRIRSQLGRGGFGSVYEAVDESSGAAVALKHLTHVSGDSIYRFKKEFRALADHRHPNLVQLLELFSDGEEWFFSMELIRGQRFDTFILGERPHVEQQSTVDDGGAPVVAVTGSMGADAAGIARLRPALAQLVTAVARLHAAGVVHRDLKPGNVLVTPDGRVVVLDFGLVTEAGAPDERSAQGLVFGTPMYMAPEQGLGQQTTPASDWYALGVMLFEVLHGRPPFVGTASDVLTQKLNPDVSKFPPLGSTPAGDLDQLARALLAADPAQRPGGVAIAAAVAGAALDAGKPAGAEALPRAPFVGRVAELMTLRQALAASRSGKTAVARVRGPSGVGKSALLDAFVRGLGPEVVVLRGRCYERESVPYKAFDGVVDALTRYLGRLPDDELKALVPPETQALCRLFPVFLRLEAMAAQPQWMRSSSPQEERRRGFAALRELLYRVSENRPLVVVIDDLQWGDVDSVEPLRELAGGDAVLRMLLVLASRAEDLARSRALQGYSGAPLAASEEDEVEIELAPLSTEDAQSLAEALLAPAERHRAPALARESGGLPLFLPELARAHRQADGPVSLDGMLRARAAELTPPARRLLDVLALAGRPLRRALALKAACLTVEGDLAVSELVTERMARVAPGERALLETFHDRVRESVAAAVPADEAKALHAALAAALAESPAGEEDGEALAEHYRLAGDLERARPAAAAAARRAFDAFAYERAVALYTQAREGAPPKEWGELTAALAEVLAYSGKNQEAAREYLASAKDAAPEQLAERERRAAELFMRAGLVDEGIPLSRRLLEKAGVPWRESRPAVIASVAGQRLRLRLRGFGFKERAMTPGDAAAAERVELLWSTGSSLSPIDTVRSTDILARHARAALELGDPWRASRALAMEGLMGRVLGGGRMEQGHVLAERAWEIAQRIDHPRATGWAALARSVVDWSAARWREGARKLEAGLQVMAYGDPEGYWSISVAEVWWRIRNLYYLGELEQYCADSERATQAAHDRGDLLTLLTALSSCRAPVHLLKDRPDEARDACTRKLKEFTSADAWYVQHQESLRTAVLCDLYQGRPADALGLIRDAQARMDKSLLLHSEAERWLSYPVFASAAVQGGDLGLAEKWHRELSKQRYPAAQVWAQAVWAGVLTLRQDAAAADAYERAAVALDGIETPLFAAAARRRRGALLGGNEGARLVEAADVLLASRGVVSPEKFSKVLVG